MKLLGSHGFTFKKCLRVLKSYIIIYKNSRDIAFTLYAALYFLLCTYIVCLSNSYADRHNTNTINGKDEKDYIAPDLILEPSYKFYLNHTWIPRDISDILVRISAALIVIRAFTLKDNSLTVGRRIFLIMGSLYLLRALMVRITILPTPWITCVADYYNNIYLDAFMLLLQVRIACGDVFFSGHTIMFTMCLMEFWYYCKNIWLNSIVSVIGVVGMYSLIMSSYHYSIDVITGFLLSVLFWVIYHWMIEIPQLTSSKLGVIINWIDDPYYYEDKSELTNNYENNYNNGMIDRKMIEINHNNHPTNMNDRASTSSSNQSSRNISNSNRKDSHEVNEITILCEDLNKENPKSENYEANVNSSLLYGQNNEENENCYVRRLALPTDEKNKRISDCSSLNPILNDIMDINPLMDPEDLKFNEQSVINDFSIHPIIDDDMNKKTNTITSSKISNIYGIKDEGSFYEPIELLPATSATSIPSSNQKQMEKNKSNSFSQQLSEANSIHESFYSTSSKLRKNNTIPVPSIHSNHSTLSASKVHKNDSLTMAANSSNQMNTTQNSVIMDNLNGNQDYSKYLSEQFKISYRNSLSLLSQNNSSNPSLAPSNVSMDQSSLSSIHPIKLPDMKVLSTPSLKKDSFVLQQVGSSNNNNNNEELNKTSLHRNDFDISSIKN